MQSAHHTILTRFFIVPSMMKCWNTGLFLVWEEPVHISFFRLCERRIERAIPCLAVKCFTNEPGPNTINWWTIVLPISSPGITWFIVMILRGQSKSVFVIFQTQYNFHLSINVSTERLEWRQMRLHMQESTLCQTVLVCKVAILVNVIIDGPTQGLTLRYLSTFIGNKIIIKTVIGFRRPYVYNVLILYGEHKTAGIIFISHCIMFAYYNNKQI